MNDLTGSSVEDLHEAWYQELVQVDHDPDPAWLAQLEVAAQEQYGVSLLDVRKPVAAAVAVKATKATIPADTPATMKKNQAVVKGKQVVGKDAGFPGSEVKLLDGTDAKPGARVKAVKTGKVGNIVSHHPNPNYSKVKFDGSAKTQARSKRTLKSHTGTAAPTPILVPLVPGILAGKGAKTAAPAS